MVFLAATRAGSAQAPASAQGSPSSNLGLAAIGAAGVYYGDATSVERARRGWEIGALVDFGWLRSHYLRLQGEISYLEAHVSEFVEIENRQFEGRFQDLTSSLSLVLHGANEQRGFVPFLATGVGVHALSSAFGEVSLDQRYNANPFGVHVAAGARVWLPGTQRHGVFMEVRRSLAEHVNRTTLRFGGLVFFNDLIRTREAPVR